MPARIAMPARSRYSVSGGQSIAGGKIENCELKIMNRRKKFIILIIGVTAVLSTVYFVAAKNGYFGGGSNIPEDTMTRGLVGYWNFDEGSGTTAYDASDNSNDGTLENGPKWTEGKEGGGLDFDGTNDYVDCGNANSIKLAETDMTISVWINPESWMEDQVWIVVKTVNGDGYKLQRAWGSISFKLMKDWVVTAEAVFPISDISFNSWNHLVATFDGSNAKIYLNTILKDEQGGSYGEGATAQNLMIGADGVASRYNFNGTIDEVRIYNRALSAEEVRYHYNRGGPVAHWKFDEGTGESAQNSTENNNDTTLKSSALDFDGTNDYVSVTTDFSGPTDMTYIAWIYPESGGQNNLGRIIHKKNNSCGVPSILMDDRGGSNGDNALRFEYMWTTQSGVWNSPDGSITFNEWNHIAITYSNTDIANDPVMYINGVSVALTEEHVPIGSSETDDNSLFIGNRNDFIRTFDGAIDEVRIYNTALTAEEIARHYNGDFSQDPTGDLVMLHHFEEGMLCDTCGEAGDDNCLTDDSGNSNHGTLENFNALTSYDNGTDGWITTVKKPSLRWTTGKQATAGNFDGGGDRVYQAYDADFNFGTNSFTISSWFKHNTTVTTAPVTNDYLLSRYDADKGYKVWMDDSGDMCFGIDDDNSWGPDDSACTSGIDYDDNQWHHLTAYKDGTTAIYLYIDSVLVASKNGLTAIGTLTSSSAELSIGSDLGVGSEAPNNSYFINTWEGEIDDLKIYGYARSPDEIRLDYNAGFATRFGPSGKTCSTDPASCMDHGLVGYWNMDEGSGTTAYDASDNSNDGTFGDGTCTPGSGKCPKWSEGKDGGALDFDGANDLISITDSNDFTPSNVTVMAWIKCNAVPASGESEGIVDHYVGRNAASGQVSQRSWALTVKENSGAIHLKGVVSDDGTYNSNYEIEGSTDLGTSNWHHVALVFEASSKVEIFLNGISEGTAASTPASLHNSTYPLRIGLHYYASGHVDQDILTFDGKIDEVKIYTRALSAEEVRYHYNRGGPVLHYKFDEGSGTTAHDTVGNADADFPAADVNKPSWSR